MSDTGKARTLLLGQLVSTLPAFTWLLYGLLLCESVPYVVSGWYGADNDESVI